MLDLKLLTKCRSRESHSIGEGVITGESHKHTYQGMMVKKLSEQQSMLKTQCNPESF